MLTIAFGSQTGNANNLAFLLSDELLNTGIKNRVVDMADLPPENLLEIKKLLIVTSTFGDGEAPDNASEWLSYLKFSDDLNLKHLSYAILGLGDTYYPHFCQCAKDFDHYLSKHGGHCLVPRLDCDVYYEQQYSEWLLHLISVLKIL